MRTLLILVIGVVTTVLSQPSEQSLHGSGVSFMVPAMTTWKFRLEESARLKTSYQPSPRMKSIQDLVSEKIDFVCIDEPLSVEEAKLLKKAPGKVVYVPIVLHAIVPVYNLPDVNGAINATGKVIAEIGLGKITKWDDRELQKDNPRSKLPSRDITLVFYGFPSRATSIFTQYLANESPEWREKRGSGSTVSWPKGIAARGGEGPESHLRTISGAFGYLDFGLALESNLQQVALKNKEGTFLLASPDTIKAAAETVVATTGSIHESLLNAPGKKSYPISQAVWAVTSTGRGDTEDAKERARRRLIFFSWLLAEGQKEIKNKSYVPLPTAMLEKATQEIQHHLKKGN